MTKRTIRSHVTLLLAIVLFVWPSEGDARRRQREIEGVGLKNRLGKQLDLRPHFQDYRGRDVKLADFFDGKRPVMLTLNYYKCKTLCNVQLNRVTVALKKTGWKPGKRFRVVTISIDPREKSQLASDKRSAQLGLYGTDDKEFDWTFLVGDKANIDRVANDLGFQFKYIKKLDIFSHVPAVFFLSPSGKLTRFLTGLNYEPRDIKFSLMDASNGKLGSVVDKVLAYCYHFDPNEGKYGPLAFNIMKLGGILTVLILGTFLAIMWRRERRRHYVECTT